MRQVSLESQKGVNAYVIGTVRVISMRQVIT